MLAGIRGFWERLSARLRPIFLSSYGITPLLIAEPAPTPAISYAVIQSKADGAINFTASHNPPEYNGIKFSTPDGAPALPEVTKAIEAQIAAYDRTPQAPRAAKARRRNRSIRAECTFRACAKSWISRSSRNPA